jgi:pimeloyl-ACP methyl ester carboxylesterase
MSDVIRIPGLTLRDHVFELPLDHERPEGDSIEIYAREVRPADDESPTRPFLVFLQGGPGFGSPRPGANAGWIKCALDRGYRVLLLDQRGTARSTPQTPQSLARLETPQAQAARLSLFRADAIVRDCELIRRRMLGEDSKWSVLGQSYGGFCITHYLSCASEGLAEAIITGGLPPIDASAEDIYRQTYVRCREKNRAYQARYPGDGRRVREIVDHLQANDVRLPSGGRLTARRFQQLGLSFGMSDGFEPVHYLMEEAFVEGPHGPELSFAFLRGVENSLAYETNPIFAILHEACYAQAQATNWAAHRVLGEFPEFEIRPDRAVYFTGEMIYPWMFEDYLGLHSLREAAEILAQKDDWPRLYDRAQLAENRVPCAAALYHGDMYVDRHFSLETAEAIAGLKLWVTNEYEHNGLRADGERVLGRLLDMVQGRV